MQCRRPTSLESLMASATTSLQGRSDEQRSWDLHLAHRRASALSSLENGGTSPKAEVPCGR
jgi:hypothetical protein